MSARGEVRSCWMTVPRSITLLSQLILATRSPGWKWCIFMSPARVGDLGREGPFPLPEHLTGGAEDVDHDI